MIKFLPVWLGRLAVAPGITGWLKLEARASFLVMCYRWLRCAGVQGLATILKNYSVILYFSSSREIWQQSGALLCAVALNGSCPGPTGHPPEHPGSTSGKWPPLAAPCAPRSSTAGFVGVGLSAVHHLLLALCPQLQGGLVFPCGWVRVIWLILADELWVEAVCGIFTLEHLVASGRPPSNSCSIYHCDCCIQGGGCSTRQS